MVVAALIAYLAVSGARAWLSWLNLRHLAREGHRVPVGLEGLVDRARLGQISDYTSERARFGLVHSALSTALTAAFLFGGGLGWYDRFSQGWSSSFVGQSVLFVLGLTLAGTLLEIPFQLYGTFRIEARHGFNRQTWGLWWTDWVKGVLLSVVLTSALSAGAFALVQAAPNSWWLWVSALIAAVSLLMTFVSPYVIEPLFNKLEPLEVDGLSDEIRSMTARAGVSVARVLKVDASRRSGHSNAYFTGL